jgi:hypothetical protein
MQSFICRCESQSKFAFDTVFGVDAYFMLNRMVMPIRRGCWTELGTVDIRALPRDERNVHCLGSKLHAILSLFVRLCSIARAILHVLDNVR